MEKLAYIIQKIDNQIKELNYLLKNNLDLAKNKLIEIDLETLYEIKDTIIENDIIETDIIETDIIENDIIENDIIETEIEIPIINFNKNSEYIDTIYKTNSILNNHCFDNYSYEIINRTEEEIFTLVHDFFKETNPKIYALFLKLCNDKNNSILFKENFSGGIFCSFYNSNNSYIIIEKDNTINDEIYLAHELGHGIGDLINSKIIKDSHFSMLKEIPSTFIEMIYKEYYNKNNPYANEYTIAEHDLLNSIKEFSTPIFFEKIYQKDINFKKMLYMNSFEREDNFIYSYSFAVALELLHIYYTDPEKAFYLLDKIITMPNAKIITNIDKLQIYPNEHLEEYQKKLYNKGHIL